MDSFLEITGVVFNLAFLFFMIKERKVCWLFGIFGSLISIYLFYQAKLYSECILYSFYVLAGIYGFYLWNNPNRDGKTLEITRWKFSHHFLIVLLGFLLALILGFIFDKYTNAEKSYLDAFTTVFSFVATYLEAKKVLSGWIYWIVLNGLSVYLYYTGELFIYSFLATIYFGASFYGYIIWKGKYDTGVEYDIETLAK